MLRTKRVVPPLGVKGQRENLVLIDLRNIR